MMHCAMFLDHSRSRLLTELMEFAEKQRMEEEKADKAIPGAGDCGKNKASPVYTRLALP